MALGIPKLRQAWLPFSSLATYRICSPAGIAAARSIHARASDPPKVAFCFDIDGVLKKGEDVIPEAVEALTILNDHGIPYIFMTNGGGYTEEKRALLLTEQLRTPTPLKSEQILQAHTPIKDYALKKYENEAVLIIGGKGSTAKEVAQSYGLKKAFSAMDVIRWNEHAWPFYSQPLTNKIDDNSASPPSPTDFSKVAFKAVFLFTDSRDWGLDIQVASDIISSVGGVIGTRKTKEQLKTQEVDVVFCNPDLLWGNNFPLPRYGSGAFKSALRKIYEETYGHDIVFTQLGKPFPATYDFGKKMLNDYYRSKFHQDAPSDMTVYMVGDNPASDIAGANGAHWSSILVRTGVFNDSQGPPKYTPTTIQDNVLEGIKFALKKEGVLKA